MSNECGNAVSLEPCVCSSSTGCVTKEKEPISTNSRDKEVFPDMDWSMHVFGAGESREDYFVEESAGMTTPVMFRWPQPADSVCVAGSYDGWKAVTPLKKSHADFYTIVNVPKGTHQYKFLVDGQWAYNKNEPKVSHQSTGTNNLLTVKSSDCDVFESLEIDGAGPSSRGRILEPPGNWSQSFPPMPTGTCALRARPPLLPPHLLDSILNKETPPSCDPSILQEPTHVVLNHLYTRSIKDGVLVLGVTHRYRKKYITTLLYRPL